ncbi:MAG: hypothetical protein ACJ76J_12030 [Thermoanaerobaculia bacterium]
MAKVTQGDFLNACDKLLVAATAETGQPVVDELRLNLEKGTAGAREAQARRNLHKAQAQQASRDLEAILVSARVVYSRLRHLLIGIFGLDAEKLVEFGLQPFRPPQVSTEAKVKRFLEKELEKEKPPEKGQSPTQAANSQTESRN